MKIKKGMTRNVIVLKNWVIKIPTFNNYWLFIYGLISNCTEYMNYKMYNDLPLAKIRYASKFGLFVVMEKVDEYEYNEWEKLESIIDNKYSYITGSEHEFLMEDFKPNNWGINKKGELVKIDYGAVPLTPFRYWNDYKSVFEQRKKQK